MNNQQEKWIIFLLWSVLLALLTYTSVHAVSAFGLESGLLTYTLSGGGYADSTSFRLYILLIYSIFGGVVVYAWSRFSVVSLSMIDAFAEDNSPLKQMQGINKTIASIGFIWGMIIVWPILTIVLWELIN